MKVYCRCCAQRAEVHERHVREYIPGCKNGTFVDGGTTNAYVGGQKLSLILLFDEHAGKYEPLVGSPKRASAPRAKEAPAAEPRQRRRRPRVAA